jgi:hypothetical protein
MHILVGVLGAVLVWLMLAEFFVTFLLPRRVKRDVRIARGLYRLLWRPWRAISRRLEARTADTWLGFFGPVGLIAIIGFWTLGLIVGFAALQWSFGSDIAAHGPVSIGKVLYFSAGDFFSTSTSLTPQDTTADVLGVIEAATALAILFVVIGYLPALFQAYSRREVAVSQLTPRAGSPPTAGALLTHSADRHRWSELDSYLEEWETWAAELMETHLSYPILCYFRSQHVSQSWLAGLTVILDTAAVRIASSGQDGAVSAELTLAIGRHALADLAFVFGVASSGDLPERLGTEEFERLYELASRCASVTTEPPAVRARLDELRATYEPNAAALADYLALPMPDWMPTD